MLSRRRFELTHSTLALSFENGGRHKWLNVPAGARIYVISGPNAGEDEKMVHVRWEGRQLVMFAIDLTSGGIEVHERN